MITNKPYFIALNRMPNVGPKAVRQMLQRWPDLRDAFSLSSNELMKEGVPAHLAQSLAHYDEQMIDLDLKWQAAAPQRHLITWCDPCYPTLLTEIHNAPPVLYAEGALACLTQPMLAIVGTRQPTMQGADIARQFAFELAAQGLTIVSGLARGIDGAAHQGCLDAKGRTIAVMGTGIDCIYPRQHVKLAEKIKDNGLILSEFPLKTPPMAGHFPRRNRIISGLSLATLVVESAIKSGSLLTARLALEQNRDVLAIPGSIRNPNAAGCHDLLQQGAALIVCVNDVLDVIHMKKNVSMQQHHDKKRFSLDEKYLHLVQCMGEAFITVDQLVACSGRTMENVMCELAELELEGVVQAVPGGYMRCTI